VTDVVKPENWDPRTEHDKLAALAQIAAAMHHGRPAFEQRLDEMAGGYPSKGDGGSGSSEDGGPVVAAVIAAVDDHRVDVAQLEQAEWERALRRALDAAAVVWEMYKRVAHPRPGVPRMTDPGCELCAKVPDDCERCTKSGVNQHWCPTYCTVEIPIPPKRKGAEPLVRRVRVCISCYKFQRPEHEGGAGRLPDHSEVIDHAEGRRRRRKASASA
jgi:hypothetical protein